MKELMNEFGKKVNEVAGQIGKKTEPLKKKTEIMVEIQKLKSQVRALENHNEFDLADLGEIVFVKYSEGLIEDEDFMAICEEIEQRLDAIDNLEQRMAKLKGVEICKNCEMTLQKGVYFCSNCGMKVERDVESEEEVPEMEEETGELVQEDTEEKLFEAGDVVEVLETEDAEMEIEFVVEFVEPEAELDAELEAELEVELEAELEAVLEAEEATKEVK